MENINLQLLRKINCLLTGLLAIIGFSCGENGESTLTNMVRPMPISK